MTSQLDVIVAAAGLSFVLFLACWIWGMLHERDASATDAYYGLGSLAQGALTFALWHRHTLRGGILVVLAGLWSVGLGQLLFRRWLKTHATGGDARYVMAVERFNPGANLWWISLLSLVVAQTFLVTVLNLPLELAIMSHVSGISALDVVGFVLIAIGGAIEVIANRHLELFKQDSASKGKTLMTGLWAWSRHPNYFGNTLVYFGFFVVAIREPRLWWTVVAPLAAYLMLRFGSGVRLTEWMMLQKRQDDPIYMDYLKRTSPFFPLPPRRSQINDARPVASEPPQRTNSVA